MRYRRSGKDHNQAEKLLFSFFNLDDLATAVCTRLCVYAVRHFGLARVLVDIELRRLQRVVCASRSGASFGMSTFWIWHN